MMKTRWLQVQALIIALAWGALVMQTPTVSGEDTQETSGLRAIVDLPPTQMKIFDSPLATTSVIDGVDGRKAFRVQVTRRGENNWSVLRHSTLNTQAIKKSDLVVFVLRLRLDGSPSDVGNVDVYLESAVAGKEGSVSGQFQPTTQVRTYRRSFESPGDFAAGELRLSVHLASKPQVVEIYEISMEVYPQGTSASEMRVDRITWPGREPDAPWRETANQRIDQLRKADLAVRVMTADGQPANRASVRIEQTKHQWRFGTFISEAMLGESHDARNYKTEVLKRFNFVTLPAYQADWGWLDESKRKQYLQLADWAQQNKLGARGHLLVYPGWTASPAEWSKIPKPELRRRLEAHIPVATAAFMQRGVTEWDVTNELRDQEKFMNDIGGLEVAADWFKQARKLNPQGSLYLNEYKLVANGGNTDAEQATLERHFGTLVEAGAPIDGIGMQGHFGSELTAPVRALEIIDRMSKMTGKVLITEFDMDNDDKEAQADFIRDFYTVCFSHPAVQGVVCWGFWEGDMWRPRGHFLTKDWKPTAVSRAFDDLVHKEWWTDVRGTVNPKGTFETRGFKGEYSVTVSHGGYTWTGPITLDQDKTVEVIVP
jgi:endo-1,4-beta-xylanase